MSLAVLRIMTPDELYEVSVEASAEIPWSVSSPVGVANVASMQRVVQRWFNILERTYPFGEIARLLPLTFEADDDLDEEAIAGLFVVLAVWQESASGAMSADLIEELLLSSGAGYQLGLEGIAAELGLGGIPAAQIPNAISNWARLEGGRLIKGVDETTRLAINRTVANGIANNRGIPGIMADLRAQNPSLFGGARAELVARTEVNAAQSIGSFTSNLAAGAETKEWLTVGDNRVSQDICQPNEADGAIKIRNTFGSGHMITPGHPNGRCAVLFFGATAEGLARAQAGVVPDLPPMPQFEEGFEPVRREAA